MQSFIIFSTLCFLGIGLWGALQIRQEFDPVLLLPADTYLRQWIDLHEEQWPQVYLTLTKVKPFFGLPCHLTFCGKGPCFS